MGEDAGPFERELITGLETPPPGLVAAQQRILSRADDKPIGGVIAAATENRALHGRQDVGFIAAGLDQRQRRVKRGVGQCGSAPGVDDLRRALDQP